MAGIRIERKGQRVYFVGDTYAVRGDVKQLGGHWDADRRAWWVGAKKLAEAEALVARLQGAPASPEAAALAGLAPDTPAGVVADKLAEEGKPAPRAQRPAGEVRLTGKGTYQGRIYYLGSSTRDGARVLLLGLPKADGSYFERWAPAAEVTVTKTYQPREVWDGRRYSGRTVTKHQTLGGIADFLRRQQDPNQARGQCSECGSWGPRGEPCRDCGGEGSYA
jgi:hypothetical protein